MDIRQYISATEKTYKLRIKTIVPIDDEKMDRIESAISKFQPLEISRPKKTMLQTHPLDFKNVQSAEVWIIDVVFGQPAAPSVVREEVRNALSAPETFVVVRNADEALERETRRLNAVAEIEEEATKRGLKPASLLSNDPAYEEYEEIDGNDVAGDNYNNALLTYLNKVEDEKREARSKIDNAPFVWLDRKDRKEETPADNGAYNDGIEGAHKPRPTAADTKGVKLGEPRRILKKVYLDANGKRIVIQRTIGE